MWVGMVHPETPLSITGESVLRKCLTIKGIHNYTPAHLASALHFLEQHHAQFPFDRLVSPPLPLIELPKAIDLTLSRSWLRVAIAPNSWKVSTFFLSCVT